MTVREQTEQIEYQILSPWAAKAGRSRGRRTAPSGPYSSGTGTG